MTTMTEGTQMNTTQTLDNELNLMSVASRMRVALDCTVAAIKMAADEFGLRAIFFSVPGALLGGIVAWFLGRKGGFYGAFRAAAVDLLLVLAIAVLLMIPTWFKAWDAKVRPATKTRHRNTIQTFLLDLEAANRLAGCLWETEWVIAMILVVGFGLGHAVSIALTVMLVLSYLTIRWMRWTIEYAGLELRFKTGSALHQAAKVIADHEFGR